MQIFQLEIKDRPSAGCGGLLRALKRARLGVII
jgi:hypothetical protein